MKSIERKTVHMHVMFPDRNLARPVLEDLGRDRALSVNILRGRITEEEAVFDLEVTGSVRRIDHLIRLSATWGASIGAVPVGAA